MLIRRNGLLLIFLALAVKIMLLAAAPNKMFINTKMEENKEYFTAYMEVLSGELNEDKADLIASEERYFAELEAESETISSSYIRHIFFKILMIS